MGTNDDKTNKYVLVYRQYQNTIFEVAQGTNKASPAWLRFSTDCWHRLLAAFHFSLLQASIALFLVSGQ